jgi:hypothetical protein
MKIPSKFCIAWATHQEAEEQLGVKTNSFDQLCDSSAVALTLSRHLVSRSKQKALINMMSGLDMLALVLTICREVCLYFLVIVSYSALILRSRTKGSSLINSQNPRNVSLSKYYLLVKSLLCLCN